MLPAGWPRASDRMAIETKTRRPGLIARVGLFYRDPAASVRAAADAGPGDGAVVGYGMLAGLGLFAGWLAISGASGAVGATRAAEEFSAYVIVRPLFYVGLAVIGTVIARAFGGQGGWSDGRLAIFWAALVSMPVTVVAMVAAAAVPPGLDVPGIVIGQIGPAFFAWALARCYAELFGFSRPWLVFGTVVVIVLALLGAVRYVRAGVGATALNDAAGQGETW